MNLEDLRIDCAIKQKRGIHFISASIVIWLLVMMVQFLDLPILTKNLLTFCCTAPLLPLAFLMSKLLRQHRIIADEDRRRTVAEQKSHSTSAYPL